jgi:hypothetical protein
MLQNTKTGNAIVKSASLAELAQIIRTANAAAARAAQVAAQTTNDLLLHVLIEGRALINAQEQVPKGQWGEWLRANCQDLGERHARRIVKLVRAYDAWVASGHTVSANDFAGLSLRGLIQKLTPPKRRPPLGQIRERHLRRTTTPEQVLNSLAWANATLAEQTHFISDIGWQTLAEAIPQNWYPLIQQWLQVRVDSSKAPIVIDHNVELASDDLGIPSFLQRKQPKLIAPTRHDRRLQKLTGSGLEADNADRDNF